MLRHHNHSGEPVPYLLVDTLFGSITHREVPPRCGLDVDLRTHNGMSVGILKKHLLVVLTEENCKKLNRK